MSDEVEDNGAEHTDSDHKRRRFLHLTGTTAMAGAIIPQMASAEEYDDKSEESTKEKAEDEELEKALEAYREEYEDHYQLKESTGVQTQSVSSYFSTLLSLIDQYSFPIDVCTPNLRVGKQFCMEVDRPQKVNKDCPGSPQVYSMDFAWTVYETSIFNKNIDYNINFWVGFDRNRCVWVGGEEFGYGGCAEICDVDLPNPGKPVKDTAEDARETAEEVVSTIEDYTDISLGGPAEQVLIAIIMIAIAIFLVRKKAKSWFV